MTPMILQSFLGLCLLVSCLGGDGQLLANEPNLRTTQKTIRSYAYGERTYTCLAVDGHVVPLVIPLDGRLESNGGLKVVWDKDRSFAVIRKASEAEAALLDQMDQPQGPKAWNDYLADQIKKDSDQYQLRNFEPGILAVNHWRIGAMSMDYAFAGVRSCILLLLWRTQDGTTITVTLRAGFSDFKVHRDAIYSMIGGAMLMNE